MKQPLTISLAALGGVAVLAAAAVAWGQADRAPQGPGQPPAYGAAPGGSGPGQRFGERMRERREERVRLLHDALNIRPDQEGAWRVLQDSLRPDARRMGEMWREGAEGREMTTPERLDRMAQRMQERQARFAEHAAAIKRFYAVLDPAQRRTFDSLIQLRGGGMGGMMMGHGGMGRHDGGERG